MLAHVDPWFIYSWLGALILANGGALVSIICCLSTSRRRMWIAIVALIAILLGAWVAWIAIQDGAGLDRIGLASVAPPILGLASLIRWGLLRSEHSVAQPGAPANADQPLRPETIATPGAVGPRR